jgi:type II secretory pathway pseudopilin PulG
MLRRIVIAAKFNGSVYIGWPELQIIRNSTSGTYIAFTTSTTEPISTGYLNLYEYDLAATNFDILVGDRLNISWYGNVRQRDQIRFSLAYYNNGTPPVVPMVSIVVGNCDPAADLLTLNTLYCESDTITTSDSVPNITNVTSMPGLGTSTDIDNSEAATSATASTIAMTEESINTTQTTINQNNLSSETIKIISGVVVISLSLIILLVLITFVVKRRRKSASMNVTDSIEMSTQSRMLHESIKDSNQACTTREEAKHDEAVDYRNIEMDENQAYIIHSEFKGEQGTGKKECNENRAYTTDALPTDPNVAYSNVDCIEVDTNQAYGTNAVLTDPNVVYGTHPLQINDYDYVTLP